MFDPLGLRSFSGSGSPSQNEGAPGATCHVGWGEWFGDTSKGKLDIFDGSDPSSYRQWKRRAQLMIACLPSTISSAKFGPELMSYIGGEAESLLESLPVEKICKEGGDDQIWAVLDEKYGPQTTDLLQEAMK